MRLFSQRWRSDGSLKTCCCYCMIDVILAILVGIFCGLFFIGFVPPYKRGYYCDDASIRLPYKRNTISVELLLIVSIAVPVLLVVWYHMWAFWVPPFSQRCNLAVDSASSRSYGNLGERSRISFAIGTSMCVEYFFGLMVVVALMHIGKSSFGVLRPHFIDVCRPNGSIVNCGYQPHYGPGNQERTRDDNSKRTTDRYPIYIDEPYCTTKDYFKLKIARESFPSGHSAVAVYSLFFVISFIHNRARHTCAISPFRRSASCFCPPLVRYGFSGIYTLWTVMVCVTRVTDNWHHWTDVVGGIVLGVTVGAVLFYRKDSAFRTSLTQCKIVEC